MTNALNVFFNKILVGSISDLGGSKSFSYDKNYLSSANPTSASISMPLRSEAFNNKTTQSFFSSLLPDGDQRKILAKVLGVSAGNTFSMLAKIGHECAGASEILPAGKKPKNYPRSSNTPLNEKTLSKIFVELPTNPLLASRGRLKLSLAGAQSKFAVFFDEKKNSLPQLTQNPSTHILKPESRDYASIAHNEFFCMKLAEKIGLDVAKVFLKFAENKSYLLVRRFDRAKSSKGAITRIHQEDFCQAMGISPEKKYQDEGGPTVKSSLLLIESYSSQPALDKLKFLRALIFNFMVGNCDAHGKNFSFIYHDGTTKLAPLYDIISSHAYTKISHKMAMKIGKSFYQNRVLLSDWSDVFGKSNGGNSLVEKELKNFAIKLPQLAKELELELLRNGIKSEIFADIRSIIAKRSEKILGYFQS